MLLFPPNHSKVQELLFSIGPTKADPETDPEGMDSAPALSRAQGTGWEPTINAPLWFLKENRKAQIWWYQPVIPTIQEVMGGRRQAQGQPGLL